MSAKEAPESILPQWLIVGFSGHLTLEHPEKVAEAIRHQLNKLSRRNPRLAGISSAASGGDTLFAEEMLRRKAPIVIVLPFPCDRFKEDFANDPAGWARSQILMQQAIEVHIVRDSGIEQAQLNACAGCPPVPDAEDRAPQAYMEAGCRTIDRADVLIAVWDEKEGKGFGGTADAVRYANETELPLIILNPVTGLVIEERLDKLPAMKEGEEEIPEPPPIENPRQIVENYLTHVDSLASKHAPRARQLIRWCLRLHLTASVAGAVGLVFGIVGRWGIAIAGFEVLILFVAFGMLWIRQQSYELWFLCRAKAEVCRSFLATWQIRRPARFGHQARPALSGLKDLFTTLRMLRELDQSRKSSFEQARADYEANRVIHQLNYFKEKFDESGEVYERRKLLMQFTTGGAIICTLAGLKLAIYPGSTLMTHLFDLFGTVLPLFTTGLGILLITDETSRRVTRYKEMMDALAYYKPRIKACRTWDSLARLATEVEEELLQEILEWRSFVRHTEHLH